MRSLFFFYFVFFSSALPLDVGANTLVLVSADVDAAGAVVSAGWGHAPPSAPAGMYTGTLNTYPYRVHIIHAVVLRHAAFLRQTLSPQCSLNQQDNSHFLMYLLNNLCASETADAKRAGVTNDFVP